MKYKIIITFIFLFFTSSVFADSLENMLKKDFTQQQTVLIHFEVNKRLYSFEAGKFKLEKIAKNRQKIDKITEKIIPWAIMEGLKPEEVARIIVYMYHADEAGAAFLDSEDLIPLIAKKDIPMKDFVLMVQYNRETKYTQVPEEIRNAFLGIAMYKDWDGVSILAGGRGLVLAKSCGLNLNKVGSLLLKKIPPQGEKISSEKLVSIIQGVIGEFAKEKYAQEIMNNLAKAHAAAVNQENSPAGIKLVLKDAGQAESNIVKIISKPVKIAQSADINKERGLIADLDAPSSAVKVNWQTLSKNQLTGTIKPWLGTPYSFGSKTGTPGIDCSGFTRIVLIDKKIGVPGEIIGHGTASQIIAGNAVSRQSLMPGDLVFFSASPNLNKVTHVGLVTGQDEFSHACNSGVIYDSLSKKWWKQRYVSARRVFNNVVE